MSESKKMQNIIWQAKMQLDSNWLESTRILQRGLVQFPKSEDLKLFLAGIYFSKKIFRKAVGIYHQVLKDDPANVTAIFQLANSFLGLKEYKLAVDYYNMIQATFPELDYNKAFAYSRLGQKEKSIDILENIPSQKITTSLPVIFLSEMYLLTGKLEKGIQTLEKAQKKFGKLGSITLLKGLAYFDQKNYLKAFLAFESAEKLKVDMTNSYLMYAYTCLQVGKIEKAIELMLQTIKYYPSNSKAYVQLTHLYMDNERYEEAFSITELAQKNLGYNVVISLLRDKLLKILGKNIVRS
ncbi:MAG: tetratricopeptide repeat protein [Candidatus Cloacimonetes bacterium]|nr:tetratricopeptide repeat protein [Candidatus Cloacimonadota bacterium]